MLATGFKTFVNTSRRQFPSSNIPMPPFLGHRAPGTLKRTIFLARFRIEPEALQNLVEELSDTRLMSIPPKPEPQKCEPVPAPALKTDTKRQ
jgi:hypothetical protein